MFLRLSTHKEPSGQRLTEKGFAELIYNHWVFDVPKLFDLCSLYHDACGVLLSKMLENIFTRQPAYFDDLSNTFVAISTIIHRTCLAHSTEGVPEEVPLHDRTPSISDPRPLAQLATQELIDVAVFVHDLAHTLNAFASTFPACRSQLHVTKLLTALCCLHSSIVSELTRATTALSPEVAGEVDDSSRSAGDVAGDDKEPVPGGADGVVLLAQACAVAAEHALLRCITGVVDVCFAQPAVADTSLEDVLFEALDALVLYPSVASWISREGALSQVFSRLGTAQINTTQLSFYQGLLANHDDLLDPAVLDEVTRNDASGQSSAATATATTTTQQQQQKGGKQQQHDADLEKRVDKVLMLVPDLGRGFVKACLAVCKVCGHAFFLFCLLVTIQCLPLLPEAECTCLFGRFRLL